jgi:hypothetical protein
MPICRSVQHDLHPPHEPVHEAAICDRSDLVGQDSSFDVEANRLVTRLRQPTHQRLAEMPCTTRDEDVRNVRSSILERDQAAHAARSKQSAIVSEAIRV